jgi:hypothetical protein
MSQIEEKRRERAANGSRRQRDLNAAGLSPTGNRNPVEASKRSFAEASAWASEHLPGESPNFAGGAFLTLRWHLKRQPTVDEVRQRLKVQGHDKATLTAAGESA